MPVSFGEIPRNDPLCFGMTAYPVLAYRYGRIVEPVRFARKLVTVHSDGTDNVFAVPSHDTAFAESTHTGVEHDRRQHIVSVPDTLMK